MSRCKALTKGGAPCSRITSTACTNCWQHRPYDADANQPGRVKRCNFTYPRSTSEFVYVRSPDKNNLGEDVDTITDIFTTPNYLSNRVNLINRYIHKLTLKKPLMDLGITDEIPDEISPSHLRLYSGYLGKEVNDGIFPPEYSHYNFVVINPKDILSDTVVFDYMDTNYNEDRPSENIDESELRGRNDILEGYMSGNDKSGLKLLKAFVNEPIVDPSRDYTLYRGLSWNNKKDYTSFLQKCGTTGKIGNETEISSWTSNACMAEQFATPGRYGVVLRHIFHPRDILVDTRLIPEELLLEIYPELQHEVIVRPGSYSCEIVTKIEKEANGAIKAYKDSGDDVIYKVLD